MTTLTLPAGGPRAADRGQCGRRGGPGLSLRPPGLTPGAHCPHGGPPAEGGRELPEAGRSQGLLHRRGHGLPRGARARGAVCAGQAGRTGLPRAQPSRRQPGRHAVRERPGDTLAHAGELLELRATDFVGAAQPDGQQRLPGGRVLAARPYSAAKFALDGFFGSLRRELDVQDVNVAITMCVLGLRDRASTAEGVRGITRAKAAPGPKAALAVIRGGATRAPGVFYPWRLHLLCLLRGWLPHPRAWFVRQEFNVTAAAAA
ncbi:hydroxysteroid 11-beta-dehydrogenase 1-like protein isoform X3 [Suricata suricatta]|uniref:hydroxysteroid 11-beta-dehydrogenase 1-like protein isoform X3 n=1 Tax=Suricata suricatta TaxID=37032 RepID=UPI0011556F38|nr:hydroxysteroid 11-beta-dehydrogenase 1-like protein isoform X3 [Suricata suricatta]